MLSFIGKRLTGAGSAVAFVTATAFVVSVIEIIYLSLSKVFEDGILGGSYAGYLIPFVLLLCMLGIVWAVILGTKEAGMLKISGKFSASGSGSFMWKILHLPLEFFSQRMAGDIQTRMVSNGEIASLLINIFAPIALDALMLVLYLWIMLKYSTILTLVGITSVLLNIFLCGYATRKRTNILRVMMRDEGKLAGVTVSGIEMIETIKASGAENNYFERWAGFSASVNAAKAEYLEIDCRIGI